MSTRSHHPLNSVMLHLLISAMLGACVIVIAACDSASPPNAPTTLASRASAPAPAQNPTPVNAATQPSSPATALNAARPKFVCTHAPLSAADIELYMSVMRAAADIVQHPTAADMAERQRDKAQAAADRNAIGTDQQKNGAARTAADTANQKLAAAMQAAQKSGDYSALRAAADAAQSANAALPATPVIMPPQLTPAQEDESMRIMMIDEGNADAWVAEQRQIDADRWDCVVRAVEAAVPNPDEFIADGDATPLTAQQRRQEAKWEAWVAVNKKLLTANIAEIQSLEKVVRTMHPDN